MFIHSKEVASKRQNKVNQLNSSHTCHIRLILQISFSTWDRNIIVHDTLTWTHAIVNVFTYWLCPSRYRVPLKNKMYKPGNKSESRKLGNAISLKIRNKESHMRGICEVCMSHPAAKHKAYGSKTYLSSGQHEVRLTESWSYQDELPKITRQLLTLHLYSVSIK